MLTFDYFQHRNAEFKDFKFYKLQILDYISDDNIKCLPYEMKFRSFNSNSYYWEKGNVIFKTIDDIVNQAINGNTQYYISNPTALRKWKGFDKHKYTIVDYDMLCDIAYLNQNNGSKALKFVKKDNNFEQFLAKNTLLGCAKQVLQHGKCSIYLVKNSYYAVSDYDFKCVDARELCSGLNFKELDFRNVDFSECDSVCKMFEDSHIRFLDLTDVHFDNVIDCSYFCIRGYFDSLILGKHTFHSLNYVHEPFFESCIHCLEIENFPVVDETLKINLFTKNYITHLICKDKIIYDSWLKSKRR